MAAMRTDGSGRSGGSLSARIDDDEDDVVASSLTGGLADRVVERDVRWRIVISNGFFFFVVLLLLLLRLLDKEES
jgi:hypothetical protein